MGSSRKNCTWGGGWYFFLEEPNFHFHLQVIDGEIWPPNVKDADVEMIYQPDTPEDNRFALGHRFFGILPGLVIWSTIFVREHNKICDMLAEQHPDWSDEQLFQTTRNAIIGKTGKT